MTSIIETPSTFIHNNDYNHNSLDSNIHVAMGCRQTFNYDGSVKTCHDCLINTDHTMTGFSKRETRVPSIILQMICKLLTTPAPSQSNALHQLLSIIFWLLTRAKHMSYTNPNDTVP